MPEVLPFALGEEIGLALVLLAVAGLLYVVRTAGARRLGVPLAAALAGSAVAAMAPGSIHTTPTSAGTWASRWPRPRCWAWWG